MDKYYWADSYDENGVKTFSFSLSLGDDQDCETCGYSNNEAALTISESGFDFSYQAGCTGGMSISDVEENQLQKIEDLFEHLRTYPDWNSYFEDKVRSEITSWLKDNEK
jgi:hypothetical protein